MAHEDAADLGGSRLFTGTGGTEPHRRRGPQRHPAGRAEGGATWPRFPTRFAGTSRLDTRPLSRRAPPFDRGRAPAFAVGRRLVVRREQPCVRAGLCTDGAQRRLPREVIERAYEAARELARRGHPTVGAAARFGRAAAAMGEGEAKKRPCDGRAKRALGPLDGVPFAVKGTDGGPRVAAKKRRAVRGSERPQRQDATCVERLLREQGSIPIGTTPMTEWGMTPLGWNPHRAMPRNPHAT